jgi:hypothetical protein
MWAWNKETLLRSTDMRYRDIKYTVVQGIDGTVHPVLIVFVLVVSALAGRQFFMDGTNFIVQSFLDPLWYPGDQETPRRFFAVVWTTAPVRLIGILFPSQIDIATIAYGITTYSQIALPLIITMTSKLNVATKSLIIILFVSATIFLANFAATELLFALSLTTLFVAYSLDPALDPRSFRRLAIGFFLTASYEVVALSNIILAIGTYASAHHGRESMKNARALVAVLLIALPFQLICHFSETNTPAEGAFHWFISAISGVFITGLLVAALSFKLLEKRAFLRAVVVFVAFAIPISLLFIPDLIGLRTRQFRFAYPSRIYSAGITVVIATLPILLNHNLFLWPSRVMDWFGRWPLHDLSIATLAGFYGVSIVASLDAYLYRARLEKELSLHAGFESVSNCAFCSQPTKFGLPDLSHPPDWPTYSMAHTLKHPELPPVVMFSQDGSSNVSRKTIDAFMAHQVALRKRDGTDVPDVGHSASPAITDVSSSKDGSTKAATRRR